MTPSVFLFLLFVFVVFVFVFVLFFWAAPQVGGSFKLSVRDHGF